MKTAEEARKEIEQNEQYTMAITQAKKRVAHSVEEAIKKGDTECYAGGWRRFIVEYETGKDCINIQRYMINWVTELGYSISWSSKTAHPCVNKISW
tara:strand:- start:166 stop:453 length:288 start_codon:yes stop_codon:yes gene_type:complete